MCKNKHEIFDAHTPTRVQIYTFIYIYTKSPNLIKVNKVQGGGRKGGKSLYKKKTVSYTTMMMTWGGKEKL